MSRNQRDNRFKRMTALKIYMIIGTSLLVFWAIFSIKPIKQVLVTYSMRFLSSIEGINMDETPNIKKHQLSIEAIKQNEDEVYEFISKKPQDIHKGELILVNSKYACSFLEKDELRLVKRYKNSKYKVANEPIYLSKSMISALNQMMKAFNKETGKSDMIITSGYRSLKEQNEALKEKINNFGDDGTKWAMLPGYSEHHTGYAVDMSIYTDDGIYIAYKGQGDYAWINQNCFKYGIIRRYTEDKIGITGISNEPWHYRYVGIPHAYYMKINDLCMEEYIELIRKFTFNEKHLYIETEQGNYEIYYIPKSSGEETKVPVPKHAKYTISGDNVSGFIVTVSR